MNLLLCSSVRPLSCDVPASVSSNSWACIIRPSLAPCPSLTFNAIFRLPGLPCFLQTTKPDPTLMPPGSHFLRPKVPFAFALSVFALMDGLQGDV